jgi:hypothetical protein
MWSQEEELCPKPFAFLGVIFILLFHEPLVAQGSAGDVRGGTLNKLSYRDTILG